ncbi:FAD/NAD(P)-binding domain-containing protein [Viridothelium virens]|uniref:FAD/NAD(P)-binding domain-containing protein n=1 Tax=Viridothelium virens TaxID=1048519 RepID=A0A6A6GYE3_VIRVR|nr:FAD/NAD(P)-binding domain-containing protein [Viridothelium virens]
MDILVAGARISGLTAALALRRQGHRVTLFEQSKLDQESGAAIVLGPNCNGLLRKYNFIPEKRGATLCLGVSEMFLALPSTLQDEPYQLIQRRQLHEGLKVLALDPSQPGLPVTINTPSRVVSVATETGVVLLEDGSSIQGDVVLGADGWDSSTRAAVLDSCESKITPFPAGKNCFRFLIPREKLLADPVTRPVFHIMNTLCIWLADDTRMVYYPCDDNATISFVAIHPSHLTDASCGDWHTKGSKEVMTSIYEKFAPAVRAVLAHNDPEKIKLYPLMDMQPLPRWTAGRLALIGDAAHPFLPHQGQGGAQAIEDAVSIGVFLPSKTKPSEVPERLKLSELARKERAHRIQQESRVFGLDLSEFRKADFDRLESRQRMFRYDEYENSRQILHSHSAIMSGSDAGDARV